MAERRPVPAAWGVGGPARRERPGRWLARAAATLLLPLAVLLTVLLLAALTPGAGGAQNQAPPARSPSQVASAMPRSPMASALPPGAESPENRIDGYPVLIDGQMILSIRRDIAGFTAQERALTITRRLKRIARNDAISVDDLTIQRSADDQSVFLSLGHEVLITITEQDAKADRSTPEALANQSLATIKAAINRYRADREPEKLLANTVLATAAASAFLLISFLVIKVTGRLFPSLARVIANRVPGFKLNNVEIISPAAISAFWLQVLRLVRLAALLILLFVCAIFILRLFPWTRALGEMVFGYLISSVELVLGAVANYLPNLFVVAIIISVAYYSLRALKPFFVAVERGNLEIPGFYADWAQPTYNILTVLVIALALVLVFPYLPGFNSPAFQGVSVFLGLLLSLGSTSAITNVIGGVILIYTRAFRIGDHIRVGDVVGDIIEKNFLAVRICTPANQIITIPNATLLSNQVVNYNISSRDLKEFLILQTTITLGYEVPWRDVHGTLVRAALDTEHVLRQPAPFVLQTSLDNFYVSYQLNAYTDAPNLMVIIYSNLHQSIQDHCREQGIEILSPGYTALRDGSASTIPSASDLPADSGPPACRVGSPERPLGRAT